MFAHVTIPTNLTPAQADGRACIVCGGEDGPMIPVATVDGCQVFAHPGCLEERTHDARVFVVGASSTVDDFQNLNGQAFDVADRLGVSAIVSTFPDVSVPVDFDATEYDAVVLADGWHRSLSSGVCHGKALGAGVPVLWMADVYRHPMTDVCVWCGERDEREAQPAPRFVNGTFTPAVCGGCAPHFRKAERSRQRAARKASTVV
jgi:hypothetical protein